jgi:hypothetical protein
VKPLTLVAARRWWPLALGVLLGALAGLLVSLLGSGVRRAEASVLISSPAGPAAVTPMLPNLRELAKSGVVAGNVQSTLRLTKSTRDLRRQLHATVRPQSEVIAISVTDERADHARQIAQEAAVVFAQLVDARFGTATPALHAAVLDSAHVLGGPDRHLTRNALAGALVGLLLGSAGMFLLASGARPVVAAGGDEGRLRKRESVLDQRVKGVTARERAVAVQAGKLAAREQELEARAAKVTAAEREAGEMASSQPEPEAPADAPPPPPPEPLSQPEAKAEPALPAQPGTWNLYELQKAVEAQTGVTPEQAEIWQAHLYFLREHASSDGSLPRSFDPLIGDVFGDALERFPDRSTE